METIHGDLYDYPQYYEIVYGDDWRAELDFLLAALEKHGRPSTKRVFEPACGTGRLLWRLGKKGFEVGGNDLNPKMITYCNQRLARHRLPKSAVVGDMTNFQCEKKVDLIFNMINSFRHLATEEMAVNHLQSVARSLRKGGLYILGLHLTPTVKSPIDGESWSGRRGHLAVLSSLQLKERDLKNRKEAFQMSFEVYKPTEIFRIENEVSFRTYTAEQFSALLAKVPALAVAASYDFAYEIDEPITVDSSTEDVVFILKKKD
ncbi:MAG: class I SAM-dependent methyltransferase [Pirellulaceae bacterium]|nr:class I SAM-dependent methyltransferase [Pirellulaceae bacterium]